VPVIVVHPFQRRQHRKQKREKDPDRQSYINLLKLAGQYSSSEESLVVKTHGEVPEISLDAVDTDSGTHDEERRMGRIESGSEDGGRRVSLEASSTDHG
jgi:hypothetical protein